MAKSRGRKLAELVAPTNGVFAAASIPTIALSKLASSTFSVNSESASLGGNVVLDSNDVTEHTNALYFTNARADARITAASLLPLAGGTMTGNLTLGDNVNAYFGASTDLRIYHDGTNSHIINSTGELRFTGSNFAIKSDSAKLYFGTSDDLQIYHDGSNSYINDTGTGALFLKTGYLAVAGANGNQLINAEQGAAVELYHNNAKKLETNSGGVTVTGTAILGGATFVDNATAYFGTGLDLRIYHDGSNSYIKNNTGWLNMPMGGSGVSIANSDFSESLAKFIVNGACELYHNGSKKIETTSTGIAVTGSVTSSGLTVNGAAQIGSAATKVNFYSDSTYSGIYNGSSLTSDESLYMGGDAMFFYAGGSEAVRLTTTGLGIGTGANVDELLHIEKSAGTTLVKAEVAANSIVGFEIKKTNATTQNWRIVDGQTVNGTLEIYDVTDSRQVMAFKGDGKVGIGESTPLGHVHIKTADSGASVDVSADELVVESNGNAGISILSGQSYSGSIYFGDAGVNWDGYISYSQASRKFVFGVAAGGNTVEIDSNETLIGKSAQISKTTAGNITGGASRAGAVLKLHHEAQWENGYTGGDFLGGIEFSTGDSSAGEGVRAAIKTSVDSYYNTNKLRFYVAQNANTSLLERLELEDSLIFKGRTGTSPAVEMINFDTEDNDTGRETTLRFKGHRSGGELMTNSQISGHHQGNADDDRGELKFWTNTGSGGLTEKVQIESGGDVRIKAGSLVVETGGAGIFLGGTAAVNKLDDYEEGTWQPYFSVDGGTQPTGQAYTIRGGHYVKIGTYCIYTFDVGINNYSTASPTGPSSGSYVTLGGFPFSGKSGASNSTGAAVFGYYSGFGSMNHPLAGYLNGTTMYFMEHGNAGTDYINPSEGKAGQYMRIIGYVVQLTS